MSEYGPSFDAYREGQKAMENGDHAKAIEYFEKSVEIFPHFKTLELLGECRLKVDNPKAAIVPLAAAAGLGRNEFRATYLLAVAFLNLGEKTEALKHIDRALEMNPTFKRAQDLKESLKN